MGRSQLGQRKVGVVRAKSVVSAKRNRPKLVVTKKPTPQQLKKRKIQLDELILAHRDSGRKLARSILRRWRVTMIAEDIDSIVDLALCEAGTRYEKEKGASFITFLFYHLRGHLVRAVTTATQESGAFQALASGAGIDTRDWSTQASTEMWALVPEIEASLDREIDSPETLLLRKEKATICSAACDKLDALEREVIERSYIQDEPLIDIAKSLGYSRCHISRVKKRALDRLKDHLFENSLTEVLDFKADSIVDEDEGATLKVLRRRRRRRLEKGAAEGFERAAA